MEAAEIEHVAFWEEARPRVVAPPHLKEEGARLERLLNGWGEAERWVVFASSGSSGPPKWVALRREALRHSARAVNEHLGVLPSDRWFLALPVHHVGGFGVAARAMEAGCRLETMPGRWSAREFVSRAGATAATLTSLVPAQVHDLVESALPAPRSMRAVVVGGGALREETGRRARALGWPILPSFGMTEAASQIATATLESLREPFAGAPIPLLRIWEARASEEGLLRIRGEALFEGYLREEHGRVVRDDPKVNGWFTTGDLVGMERGGIVPRGRGDRRVKILGELVDLDELEARLAPEWDRTMCVAVLEDARRGFRLVPVFEGGDHPRAAEIVDAFNAAAPGFVRLESPRFLDPWPRTSLGKTRYLAVTEKISLPRSS